MTREEVVALLAVEVEKLRGVKAAAWKWGVSDSHLSSMLNGKRRPGLKVLKLLGLKRVLSYERL